MRGREGALRALMAYRRSGAWSDDYLGGLARRGTLDTRELALAKRLCASVLQNAALCDFYLEGYIRGGMKAVSPVVADILRLAVCQICFLTRIPLSAAVNEAVTLARQYANRPASGLVNAVLRRLGAERDRLPQPETGDLAETLSLRYSHPKELVDYFLSRFGAEKTERILREDNSIPPIYLHRNPLKAPQPLSEPGLEPGPMADCYLYRGAPGALEAFRSGLVTVQDPAARLAVLAAAPQSGMRVLDACAAPGGKSFACAMLMGNKGEILACDIHEKKLHRIEEGAQRLGITILRTACADASVVDERQDGRYDLVLADVPCSGLGIIRKKPEIRYKRLSELAPLPERQLAILESLARRVCPGGVLLYSTCTLVYNENEGVIRRFLQTHGDFRPEGFTLPLVGDVGEGMCTLLPGEHDTDGFFICKLRKNA